MRKHRLLTFTRDRLCRSGPFQGSESGSAVVESTFAAFLLLVLVLGTIEVAFALYGRNVVLSAAHEGARTAVEVGRSPAEAEELARATVRRAAGGLVDDLSVEVAMSGTDPVSVGVRVRAVVDAWGPIPFPFPVEAEARAAREVPG